jgi:hypothetical protein
MDLQIYKFKKPLFQDKEKIDSDETFQTLEGIVLESGDKRTAGGSSNIDVRK